MGEIRGAVLAVHGGAGPFDAFDDGRAARGRAGLEAGLAAGLGVLTAGGSALDAVVAAVRVLEDDEEFNAGRGSVLNADGEVETDAAVADGRTGRAGAVAALRGVRNPVDLARAVLDRGLDGGGPVLLVGPAAGALARRLGLRLEPPEYFVTARRLGRHADAGSQGTVGAVARDADGNLAAATSTGGRPGKAPGRVGDSPVPGAGTWADNATCAVSGTGDGEAFLLAAFAHEVDARMRLAGDALPVACAAALEAVRRRGGTGGCIALAPDGVLAAPHTTPGMSYGWADAAGNLEVRVPAP